MNLKFWQRGNGKVKESYSVVGDSGFKVLRPIHEALPEPTAATLNAGYWWEYPPVTFKVLYDYYLKDPGIHSAVNAYRSEILGPGFHITAEDPNAQQIIEDWNEQVKFEKKLYVILGDTIINGSSLVEVLTNEATREFDLLPVDMRTIVAAQRDKYGTIMYYIQFTHFRTHFPLPPDNFVHFKLNEVGRQAWPVGIFHAVAQPYFEYEGDKWSLADAMMLIRADYSRIIHKLSSPRITRIYENEDEQWLKQELQKEKEMKAGEIRYTNKKFESQEEQVSSDIKFGTGLQFLSNAYEVGVQAPTMKLQSAAGISNATFASAEAARQMFEKNLEGYKRRLKDDIEQFIYKPILAMHGIDIKVAKLELNWGLQDKPQFEMKDILLLKSAGIISQEESRNLLRDQGLPLSDEPEAQFPITPRPATPSTKVL